MCDYFWIPGFHENLVSQVTHGLTLLLILKN